MKEYCSVIPSAKAPRKHCLAFDKLDGSNFRAKYTPKQGFCLFGTRTQLIDESTDFWGDMVRVFRHDLEAGLLTMLSQKPFTDYREVIVFGEYLGPNSLAGIHDPLDEKRIVVFDILVGHKERKLLLPQEFVRVCDHYSIPRPTVLYDGALNQELIDRVRAGNLEGITSEGVVCKGTERSGAFFGNVWMAKIKTQAYLERIQNRFPDKWKQFWE